MNGPVTDASQDPLFCSYAKRLFWFKHKGESDAEFAERLGIPCSKIRGWKYRGHKPEINDVAHIADRLNVDLGWLGAGRDHYLAFHAGVNVRMIPREPIILYQFVAPDGRPEGPCFEEGETCKKRILI